MINIEGVGPHHRATNRSPSMGAVDGDVKRRAIITLI